MLIFSQIPVTAPTVCAVHTGTDIFQCDNCEEDYDSQCRRVLLNWMFYVVARAQFPNSFPQAVRIDSIHDMCNQELIDEFISFLSALGYVFVTTEEGLQANPKAMFYRRLDETLCRYFESATLNVQHYLPRLF